MKSLFIAGLGLLWCAQSFCGISDDKVHIRAQGSMIYCDVDFGFHFNTKAPTSLEVNGKKYQPTIKEEKSIAFNTSAPGTDVFRLHFYVCDDALTICEPHDLDLRVYDNRIMQIASYVTPTEKSDIKPANAVKPQTAIVPNENGFLENQFDAAIAIAKKDNKLLLVDFRAPWCPACLRLETETFNQKSFKTATNNFVKVSINVDLAENKTLVDRYSAKSIPTMLILSSDQTELYRSLDFKTAQLFAKEISKLRKSDLVSDQDLVKLAEHDQKAVWILAKRNSDAMKFKDALLWFHQLKSPTAQQRLMSAAAEVTLLGELDTSNPNDKTKIETYQNAIKDFPESFDSIVWRNELAQIIAEKNVKDANSAMTSPQDLANQNIQKINHMISQKTAMMKAFDNSFQGDFSGFEKAELLNQKIEALKFLNDAKAMTMTKTELSKNIHDRSLSTEKAGELLLAIAYLKACDQKTEVLDWYQKLIAKNPDSFVYYAKLANYENELKEYDKALAPAEKAVVLGPELAFRNLKLLAQIQKALSKNQDAMKTVNRALSMPDAKFEKNKKYADALTEMQKTLNK